VFFPFNYILQPSIPITRVKSSPPTMSQREPLSRCPHCGSQWFTEIEFNQYTNYFSTSVGGQLNPQSSPQRAWICLCGWPIARDTRGVQLNVLDRKSFFESLAKAKQYLKLPSESLAQLETELKAAALAIADFHQLAVRVDTLAQAITGLTDEIQGRHFRPRRRKREDTGGEEQST
jgi:hypothetical protein